MLASVVYCTRVLGVEVILLSNVRETQAEADDERFRQQRDEYLADELMWTRFDDRFEIPLEQFQDDVTFTKRGMSFITNLTNGLYDKRD
ncbi:hypothetical protein LTR81_027381 [Elasticomyces elasticus]